MSETRPSFWATLPGILTGLAALITAVAGVVALVLARHDADAPVTASPSSVGVAPSPGSADGEWSGGPGPAGTSVQLQPGDGVDVDTGLIGSDVTGELVWISNQLNLYGLRNAVVPEETDEAGCVAALERRSDGWLTADRLTGGAVVCLSTDEGAVALARISPPDATDRLTVDGAVPLRSRS